ncbi:hypothetical protein EF918_17520 [Streptomyces sp. WAC06614]|nr:hypothetical protein EF918_17520 [Streptomyces sp. WAC06614]
MVTDEIFGVIEVLLDTEGGTVNVRGPGLPDALLTRAAQARPNRYAPIGTRDGSHLSLTIDSRSAAVAPARAWLPRRSYRVDTRAGSTRYRLTPCSPAASKLLKGKKRIGEFSSRGDGSVTATWRQNVHPTPQDAAMGYLLAAAFGTGSRPLGDLLLDALDALLPS